MRSVQSLNRLTSRLDGYDRIALFSSRSWTSFLWKAFGKLFDETDYFFENCICLLSVLNLCGSSFWSYLLPYVKSINLKFKFSRKKALPTMSFFIASDCFKTDLVITVEDKSPGVSILAELLYWLHMNQWIFSLCLSYTTWKNLSEKCIKTLEDELLHLQLCYR